MSLSSSDIVGMEDEVGAVEGRLSLSEMGEVVAFKLCLGAVWGRSLSCIALRYESWGCPVQYNMACCQDDEVWRQCK